MLYRYIFNECNDRSLFRFLLPLASRMGRCASATDTMNFYGFTLHRKFCFFEFPVNSLHDVFAGSLFDFMAMNAG